MYLTQSLHRGLQRTPEAIATVCEGRTRTLRESADRISRLAGALRSLGVTRGDRVAILALNSDWYHEYFFAVPWLGGVLNPVNIRWSALEIAYSIEDSGTATLLVDKHFAHMLPTIREKCGSLRTVVFVGDGDRPEEALGYEDLIAGGDPVADVRAGGGDLLGVFYTGGTTGHPKGVMLSHRNLLTATYGLIAENCFSSSGGRYLHAAPMFHLADIGVWSAGNLQGAQHVFIPAFTPGGVLHAIGSRAITDMLLVPTMIQMLIDDPTIGDHDLSSMRNFFYGASPISEALLEKACQAIPFANFIQGYGMTELAPLATVLSAADHRRPELRRSAGRAAAVVEVKIVDPTGAELPRGEVGEVLVRGDNVMLGYWNNAEATAQAVRGGWMHTGDGGYMDGEGYVFIVDRIKDMIITGGENVYSAEVENALAQHPAVSSCAVIGLPDPQWGERVHAVVVLRPDTQIDAATLRQHCRTLIANYKIPRSVSFAQSLPISGAGKILKRDLRESFADA